MAIADIDIKLLWGKAAGYCSNPACNTRLIIKTGAGDTFHVGEMAHVVSKSLDGPPRRLDAAGPDTYDNLILLCPTCHRTVDKAPEGEYPIACLLKWKSDHEHKVESFFKEKLFSTFAELKREVAELLIENGEIWSEYGPNSEAAKDPGSNAFIIWGFRKLDKIIPNNRKIVNLIRNNKQLLTLEQYKEFARFESHANSFEDQQYERTDKYATFPVSFKGFFLDV